jgi:glycine cleavage system H protein
MPAGRARGRPAEIPRCKTEKLMTSKVPKNLKYTESHEWVDVKGDVATVGITDHAQRELSDIVFVELPPLKESYEAGDECAVVESVKAASDIFMPLGGEIIAVNDDLNTKPELVNEDPYGKGWMFKIKIRDKSELEELLSAEEYEEQLTES